MYGLFSNATWNVKRDAFVEKTVETLVGQYPLLEYFRTYLIQHLEADLSSFDNAIDSPDQHSGAVNITPTEKSRVVGAVQEYIKGKVPTSLVLGGYVDSGVVDNARYPGIGQYLQNTERKISKVQAHDIMSPTNAFKEVTFAVQSTRFMNDCDSFDKMKTERDSDQLFRMTQNASFVELSNLVKYDSQDTLNVNWNTLKGWMFDSSNCSDDNMLKAFIRTQIYRPLFFKCDDYVNFTKNQSAYRCETNKYFVDHNGDEQ